MNLVCSVPIHCGKIADRHQEVHISNNKPGKNKPTDGVGKIRILKGGMEIFNVGGGKSKVGSEVDIDSGAGVILCAKLRHKDWINSLEFKMYVLPGQSLLRQALNQLPG
jgi:hypothetical protein